MCVCVFFFCLVLPLALWCFHVLSILLAISTNSKNNCRLEFIVSDVGLSCFFFQALQGTSWWSEFAFEKLLLGLAKEVTRFTELIRSSSWLRSLMQCNRDREVTAKRRCSTKGNPPRLKKGGRADVSDLLLH